MAAAVVLPGGPQPVLPKFNEYRDWVMSDMAQAVKWHPSVTLETDWGLLPADKNLHSEHLDDAPPML